MDLHLMSPRTLYCSAFHVLSWSDGHKIVLMIGEQFQSAETFSLSALQGQTLVTSVHQGKSLGKKPLLAKRDKEACFGFLVFYIAICNFPCN